MESSVVASLRSLVGRRVTLPGHFAELVTTEDACPLGPGAELRVRLATGKLDEVGLLIAPAALPEQPAPTTGATDDASAVDDTTYPRPGGMISIREKPDTRIEEKLPLGETPGELAISFTASRNDLYADWAARANLADMDGRVSVNVKAASEDGLDQARIENGALEPLRKLGLLDARQS